MARVFTRIMMDRSLLNAPALRVEWTDGGDAGHVEIFDDDARAIVDPNTGAMDHAKLTAHVDAVAALVVQPGTLSAKMAAASDADATVRASLIALENTRTMLNDLNARIAVTTAALPQATPAPPVTQVEAAPVVA